MNNQVLFISVVLLSVSVAFLFYQNVKLSRKVDQNHKSVNNHMNELTHSIALNNNINVKGGGTQTNNQVMDPTLVQSEENLNQFMNELTNPQESENFNPEITPELQEEISQLKSEYNEYELSNELKNEIDNLERMETNNLSPELSPEQSPEFSPEFLPELSPEFSEENFEEPTDELTSLEQNEQLSVEELSETSEFSPQISNVEPEHVNLNEEIIDWNNEVQEISLEQGISLDSEDIKAEVAEGVNELVGNIIASASDVEVVNDNENKITIENNEESVVVTLNNEQRALEDLNGNELKEVCKHFNLKAKGKKIELIERIKDYQLNLKNSKNFFVYTNN
jgi:hypothetical protein